MSPIHRILLLTLLCKKWLAERELADAKDSIEEAHVYSRCAGELNTVINILAEDLETSERPKSTAPKSALDLPGRLGRLANALNVNRGQVCQRLGVSRSTISLAARTQKPSLKLLAKFDELESSVFAVSSTDH